MQSTHQVIHQYRRTDHARLGEWAPVGSTWKTAASAGLVAHDIYHHLPTDTGSFAQEVAALGAEWYINIQPAPGAPAKFSPRDIEVFGGVIEDIVLNALDSKERRPFALPVKSGPAVSSYEMAHFQQIARAAHGTLRKSSDLRAHDCEDFQARFVQNLLWGMAQAKERFPDQRAARTGSDALIAELTNLELGDDVPFGHLITVTLTGYTCRIEFDDADAPFLAETRATTAMLMPWHSYEDDYPLKEATVHTSAGMFIEYVERHFEQQDLLELDDSEKRLPEGESDRLRPVYLVTSAIKEALLREGSLKVSLDMLRAAEQSPRGVLVL